MKKPTPNLIFHSLFWLVCALIVIVELYGIHSTFDNAGHNDGLTEAHKALTIKSLK